jgi:hypothetical protein
MCDCVRAREVLAAVGGDAELEGGGRGPLMGSWENVAQFKPSIRSLNAIADRDYFQTRSSPVHVPVRSRPGPGSNYFLLWPMRGRVGHGR